MPLLALLAFLRFLVQFCATIWRELRNPDNPEFRGLLTLVLILLGTGTLFYHFVEGWKLLDSLYFSVTTLTTVGYGDLAPKTGFGKLFTIVYILSGLGVLVGFVNVLATHAIRQQSRATPKHVGDRESTPLEGQQDSERVGLDKMGQQDYD
jgi:voltage-gated potassium channel